MPGRSLRSVLLWFGILSFVPAAFARADEGDERKVISRIGVGSCAHQDRPQPVWDAILADKPELFLMLGDNVYGDTPEMDVLRKTYAQLAAVPGFVKLRERCTLMATWDDHDYGLNDAGADFAMRAASQQVFLDFFGVGPDSPRRKQEGVYSARVFGPPGKRVQVIMLDTRYFRSPLKRRPAPREQGTGPYVPNTDPGATVLGEVQWKWLEERLREPAELRVIGSSIQVVASEHHYEKWGNFPAERRRLLRLVRETKANGVFVVSGDRHQAELCAEREEVAYPLYDLTSSGLNQTRRPDAALENEPRRLGNVYRLSNFGLITVDWADADPRVRFEIRDVKGDLKIDHDLRLSELRTKD